MNTKLNRCSLPLWAAVLALALLEPKAAQACGGFFCNASQPVNQAAERIVFADNGDGTVTAVIQIQYTGPADKFAWLLPIPTAPKPEEFKVASDESFRRLQVLTNPQYLLNTKVEGNCRRQDSRSVAADAGAFVDDSDDFEPGVNVEASGSVGPFDWEVISVDDGAEDPAAIAVSWLGEHDYAVPESTAGLVGPYLRDGLFLLAVKLTKTASVGSIRPIVITYEAEQAMIPVKLTSVAANDDMGVMTWLLGKGRGVPQNYLSLELNEARINWFNPSANYNQVVIEAADDAGGQGFVTEYAGETSGFRDQIWYEYEEQQWSNLQNTVFGSFEELFNTAYGQYGSYEGFWDAVSESVTLSQSVSFADFKLCPTCYADQVTYEPSAFLAALETQVVEPMRVVQKLVDAHPEMTRLYTTLSADEMTLDPLFTFNPDLPTVSNLHTADRVVECDDGVLRSDAPWRIELPQGGSVRGTAGDARSSTWPSALDKLPPNRSITRQSSSGSGKVLEDNAKAIKLQLSDYNDAIDKKVAKARAASNDDGGGCQLPRNVSTHSRGLLLVALAALWMRRRGIRS